MPLVYSTNPDIRISSEEEPRVETLPPSRQKLTVYLDRRNRGGKAVTLVKGFTGREEGCAGPYPEGALRNGRQRQGRGDPHSG